MKNSPSVSEAVKEEEEANESNAEKGVHPFQRCLV